MIIFTILLGHQNPGPGIDDVEDCNVGIAGMCGTHVNNDMYAFRNYMNDSLRTDVFVRYQPETVACACIYLTSRKLNISLPKSPAWFTIFSVSEEDIQDVCYRILRLYKRPKVST